MLTKKRAPLVFFLLLLPGCSDTPPPTARRVMSIPANQGSWDRDTPFILPGLKQPSTVAADDAQLDDDAPVIGVSAGTRHRAYSLKAMTHVFSHVVNDVIESVPVTITYCDRNDMGRCFTRADTDGPLGLDLGGWKDQKVLLKLNDRFYAHDASDIPLDEYDFQRTTWGEWKKEHPDTDVYTTPPSQPGGSNAKSTMGKLSLRSRRSPVNAANEENAESKEEPESKPKPESKPDTETEESKVDKDSK